MPTLTRRGFLALAGAIGTVGTLAACTPAASTSVVPTRSGGPSSRLTIGLTYIPNIQFAPVYAAAYDHAFGNVTVDLRHHGAQEGLFTAIAAGQEDYVVAGGDELLQARAQGMDLVAVASYYAAYPVRVIARADANITTLADLRGRTIGVPGRYGESWFGLLVALKNAKLAPADVTISEIGYTLQAAMAGKKVDAVVGFTNNDTVQLRRAKVNVVELPLGSSVPLVGACLITTGKRLRDRRDEVVTVARGVVRGMQICAQDADKAVAAAKVHVPTLADPSQEAAARETLAATQPLFTSATGQVDGKLVAQTWTDMVRFMRDNGLLMQEVDAAKAFDASVLA